MEFESRLILNNSSNIGHEISTSNCKTGSTPAAESSFYKFNDHPIYSSGATFDESFRNLEQEVPKSGSAELRLSWLRSQVIGASVEFDAPSGKRRLTYADHTASGRSLNYIESFITNNVLPFYGNTHTGDSYVGRRTTKMVHEAGKYVKKCLGGGEDDALIFCGQGTTSAIKRLQEVMGITVPSILRERVISTLSTQDRWVVFIGPYEHHSNILSWRQSLAEVVEIGLNDEGLLDMEALIQKLESFKQANRPILGSFSACSNVTGVSSDTRAIARVLHRYGGFVCFDYAASGPYVEIDMKSGEIDGYDGVYLSPHKFIGGPGTPGILLMNKALYQLRSSPPSTCGGGTVDYVNGFSEKDTLYVEDIEERENGGTPQIIQTIRAALAFWVKDYIGYEVIEKYEQMFIRRALQRLLLNRNIRILGNTSVERQAILSFLIYTRGNSPVSDASSGYNMWGDTENEELGNTRDKPLHGSFVTALLNDLFGIQARGGCACAGPYGHALLGIDETTSHAYRSAIQEGYVGLKPGWTRVSFPYYMSNDEFEFILAALEFVAAYGQRFLSLYNFNFKRGSSWTVKKKALQTLASVGKTNNGHAKLNRGIIDSEKQEGLLISKFASYLETATNIASLLPKFPPKRKLEEDVHINCLQFRI
ncbi:uncharacterized protein LOC126794772 [Argentina anserina]|uniref:uncharacterized protein LOC126794772 n=1 Tax=Argentina anserina TaxID=57926 RepID=UPI0021767BB5|nr:uncharacterized protein LOC126794772 [Potentilla anserina]